MHRVIILLRLIVLSMFGASLCCSCILCWSCWRVCEFQVIVRGKI